jgi:thiamine kinase-like enzyme
VISNPPLPPEIKSRIENLIGSPVESYRCAEGGYTPALRLVCRTVQSSFFAKVGVTPLTNEFIRREIRVYNRVGGSFMPRLIAYEESENDPILIIEDLSSCDWTPSWNGRKVEMALKQIEAMHQSAARIEPYSEILPAREHNWQQVAAAPGPFLSLGLVDAQWLDRALPILIENEERCPSSGDALCHWDLRSDNMCFANDRAVFVDWNLACLSNPKLDLGFWLPSLEYEGGPKPETILPEEAEIAAWVSGFFASRAGLPEIADAPRVRLVQRRQLETALPWAVREMDLPPMNL